jgi:hypothetical protein
MHGGFRPQENETRAHKTCRSCASLPVGREPRDMFAAREDNENFEGCLETADLLVQKIQWTGTILSLAD